MAVDLGEAAKFFKASRSSLLPAFQEFHEYMVSALKCTPRVETIYVRYSAPGGIVAAAYPRAGGVEVGLALEDESASEMLVDGSHLKWRTLPVALTFTDAVSLDEAKPLLAEAARRVASGAHDVKLTNRRIAGGRPRYDY